MNISNYEAFFHDGSIMDIRHSGDEVEFSMASAEIDEEDVKDDVVLSKDDSIQEKLYIEGLKSIIIDKQPFFGKLAKEYDGAGVFDLEIKENIVEVSVKWINYPPKLRTSDFSTKKIETEKIWLENIPDLETFY